MTTKDDLDLQALQAAKKHMGSVAWPTVALGICVTLSYLATPALVVMGLLPLIVAVPLMTLLTYAAYTVLHEAVHGTISGSNTSLRWLNEALGYSAAWIMMIPLTAHRHEHLAHHRHTNQPDSDPDAAMADITRSPSLAIRAVWKTLTGQFTYYVNNRWNKGPRRQNFYLCLEVIAALLPRLAFIAAGFWVEGLAMFVLAWVAGFSLLMYLFAYIVHAPHEAVGRYVDTSTILVDGPAGKLITALWAFQNYHSIHHLFPRVPFYNYPDVFTEIRAIMEAKGAPIYHLNTGGLLSGTSPQGQAKATQ